jgi:hypothetical protein
MNDDHYLSYLTKLQKKEEKASEHLAKKRKA